MSYLPTAPIPIRYGNRGLRVLLGIGWGLRIAVHHLKLPLRNEIVTVFWPLLYCSSKR